LEKPVDYDAIKQAVSIEKAARFLGLELKKHGDTFRCACPVCQQGGNRCIVITPAKAVWYCFGIKKGGDCIYLTAHIKGIKQSEAAALLQETFMRPARPGEPEKPHWKRKSKTSKTELRQPAGGTEYTILDFLKLFA
jgi:DNA primase